MARIAIVEQDLELREMLLTMLTEREHEAVAFTNGVDALLEVKTGNVELILANEDLGQLDGISLCRAVRESYAPRLLPILLMSHADQASDMLKILGAGANEYLVKPFYPSLLMAKISIHLEEAVKALAESDPDAPPVELLPEEPTLPFQFDRYELLEWIGQGGQGEVYKARRLADGQQAALKILHRDINQDAERLGRYFREVDALSRVNSPHVVRIYGSGFVLGHYYLAMQFVEGQAADLLLDEHGPFSIPQALKLGAQMCAAIGAIHREGLVHRDVKPSNMMVRDALTTLVDFGLAKGPEDQGLTRRESLMGTPAYIPPEVLRGEPEHVGSDLYALGIALNELLVGEPPFPELTPYQLLAYVAAGNTPRPVRKARDDVPLEVSDFIGLLTEPDPDKRFVDPYKARAVFEQLYDKHRQPA